MPFLNVAYPCYYIFSFHHYSLKASPLSILFLVIGLIHVPIKQSTGPAVYTSDYYNIYYSIDDGLSLVSIASSYNTIQDSFEWDVPNVSTVNALIKVEDALDDSIYDTNDGVFIIDAR